MSEDQFTKLYKYMQQQFGEIRAELETKASAEQLNQVYNIVDGIAKRLDADDQELAAMTAQLDRHDRWIGQLAENTGTKLQPEQ